MMPRKKKSLYKREFLNKKGFHSNAHIFVEIGNYDDIKKKIENGEKVREYDFPEIIFDLMDCSRLIHLDFDIGDKAERTNSLYKINKLKEAINDFEKEIKKLCELADKNDKLKKAPKA